MKVVFEATVFWVMFVVLGYFISMGCHKRGIEVWMNASIWQLLTVAVIVKLADTTVTLWVYAHGLGWAESNPIIGTLDAFPDFTIWVIPQVLLGWGLVVLVIFAALLSFTPKKHPKTRLVFLFLWTVTLGISAVAPISWVYPIFFYDGVAILP